jgi:hypothetical protein
MRHPLPLLELQDDVAIDDGDVLTAIEVELLGFYESMSIADQTALQHVAQFLEQRPQDEPMTKEKWQELFLSAKNLQ